MDQIKAPYQVTKNTVKIPADISGQVLTVGLPYENFKGGISMVINTYSKYFTVFNFISSYKRSKYKLITSVYYPYFVVKFFGYLLFNPQIKIVHIHGAAKGSIFRKYGAYVIASKIFGKKVIYHSHGSELKLFYENSGNAVKKFLRHFFRGVDEIICLSWQWEKFFVDTFGVENISVLENIVERNDYTDEYVKVVGDEVTFLFLGSIGPRKGLFDLLEVINDNRELFEGKLKLLIGGRGETKRLEEFLNTNNLTSIVDFVGWVTKDEKAALLYKSNVYVLPSYNEGLPISILEALSFKLPILSTSIGGIPEIVKEGVNGFLITPGDKEALLQKLKWFIENPGEINRMGQVSFDIVRPYYADEVIPRLQAIYIELLKKDN